MTSEPRFEPTLIEPLDLHAAAAALCSRFGEPTAEAHRLSTLHDLLGSSRALARALDEFTNSGSAHYRGVHCAADMHGDVDHVTRALRAWSESVFAAGFTYRAWQGGERFGADGAVAGSLAPGGVPAPLVPYTSLADGPAAPLDASPA
jgi:hypothetical protein